MNEKLSTEQRIEALEARIAIISTGFNAILTELAKIGEAEQAEKQRSWDPLKINWTPAQGPRGPFERSEDVSSRDFKALSQDLAEHDGKMIAGDFFYWKFQNGTTIGRKKRSH